MQEFNVRMTRAEWDHVIQMLATKCLWAEVNQPIMKISFQVAEQVKANGKLTDEQPTLGRQ